MEYFYVPPQNIAGDRIEIEGEEFNHLVHVMRRKEGDVVRVVDGAGMAYDVQLVSFGKRTAVGTISARYHGLNEPKLFVHLAAALLKNPGRFDFLVEKATEIGVSRITPIKAERVIPRHARPGRWQKLALAGMKQSGRSVLPRVDEPRPLADLLPTIREYNIAVVCHEAAEPGNSLAALAKSVGGKSRALIIVGPEGGFTEEEVARCVAAGCVSVSLGPRRLRAETAAVVAAALVLQS